VFFSCSSLFFRAFSNLSRADKDSERARVLLDAPYQEVNVRLSDRFGIDLVHKDKTNHIETMGISAKIVFQAIEDVSKSSTQTTVTH
jgi:hypothetical protein